MEESRAESLMRDTKNAVRAIAVLLVYGSLWTVIGGALMAGGFFYNLTAFRIYGDADEGNGAILFGIFVVVLGNLGTIIAALSQLNRRN